MQKKFRKSGAFKIQELEEIMQKLIDGKNLELKHRDHELTGEYAGYRECHIKSDLLLIYVIDTRNELITFSGIGTHSELF